MGVTSTFDLLGLLIILALSAFFVLFTSPQGESARTKLANIGGCAFMLWALLRIGAYLLGKGGA